MAYEGLANALIQIGNDYGRTREEQRLHERSRAEREADKKDQRDYEARTRKESEETVNRVADRNVQREIDASLKRIKELEPVQRRAALEAAAEALGIEGAGSMSNAEISTRIDASRREKGAADILANALATATAQESVADKTRNDPDRVKKAEKDQSNRETDNRAQISATRENIARLHTELADLTKGTGAPVVLETVDSLGQKRAQEFLSNPGTSPSMIHARASMLPGYNKKMDVAQAKSLILANVSTFGASPWADQKAVDAANLAVTNVLKQGAYAEHPLIGAKVAALENSYKQLAALGVSGQTAAPAPAAPAAQPVPSAPAASSGPNLNLPSFANPISKSNTGSPVPVLDVDAKQEGYGGLIGVGNAIMGAVPSAGAAAGAAYDVAAAPARLFQYGLGGSKLVSEGDAERSRERASVQKFFSPGGQTGPDISVKSPLGVPGTGAPALSPQVPDTATRLQAAREWLAKSGVKLDPFYLTAAETEFTKIVTSGLPMEEQAVRIRNLQQAIEAKAQAAVPSPRYWGQQ